VGPLRKFFLKPSTPAFMHIRQYSTNATVNVYPTFLLWVAVLNTTTVKIKYARPTILAGHLFGNHCFGAIVERNTEGVMSS